MQQIMLPVVGAIVAGGTAMLVAGNPAVAVGIGIGCGVGVWLAQKRQAPPA
jgi:hypothetical protein